METFLFFRFVESWVIGAETPQWFLRATVRTAKKAERPEVQETFAQFAIYLQVQLTIGSPGVNMICS